MTAQLPPVPPPYRPQHTGPHTYRPQHTGPYNAPAAQNLPQPSSFNPVRISWTDANGNYPAPPPPVPVFTATPHVIRGDRNGMGTAGLVLGIVALCFAVIPVVGVIAWVLFPLGVVFSGVGLNRADRALATNRNAALAGMIVSLVAAAVCIAWVAFTVYASSGAH